MECMDEILEFTIYSITCFNEKVKGIYVGSTSDFANRKKGHYSDSNDENKNQKKVYKYINSNGGWDNWKFTCLEILTCTETEARIIERDWYDKLEADLNSQRPYISDQERKISQSECSKRLYYKTQDRKEQIKQYYFENKEAINERQKQCYFKNKEAINKRQKQYDFENKEAITERHKQYKFENKDKIAEK